MFRSLVASVVAACSSRYASVLLLLSNIPSGLALVARLSCGVALLWRILAVPSSGELGTGIGLSLYMLWPGVDTGSALTLAAFVLSASAAVQLITLHGTVDFSAPVLSPEKLEAGIQLLAGISAAWCGNLHYSRASTALAARNRTQPANPRSAFNSLSSLSLTGCCGRLG